MKYKMYQSTWQGVSLLEIARKLNKSVNSLAKSDIYSRYYSEMEEKGFQFEPHWLDVKKKMSDVILKFIKTAITKNGIKTPRILSVGCGFGICEVGLIDEGWSVDLQECQDKSLNYLKKIQKEPDNIFVCETLDQITGGYDFIIINQVVYALTDSQYKNLMSNVYRLLNQGGICLNYESASFWEEYKESKEVEIKRAVKKVIGYERKQKLDLLWGYKRSLDEHIKYLDEAGLEPINEKLLVNHSEEIEIPPMREGFLINKINSANEPLFEIYSRKSK